jgi:hypothetical protein
VLFIFRWRVVVFILGLIAVGGAVALWLLPASPAMTKAVDNTITTVTDPAGHKSSTNVTRNTTTRSDAMLVGILTLGAGLLVVAVFWNRIQEFTIGGISIRLAEAATETPEIAVVSTVADTVTDFSVGKLKDKVDAISKRGLRFLRVDLQTGDKWPYLNLSVFMLLLAKRSRVEEVIFIGQVEPAGRPETYLGAASVPRLADRIAAEDPDLAAAYRDAETTPGSPPSYTDWASILFAELGRRDPSRNPNQPNPPNPDWVGVTRLDELAGPALIHDLVEYKGEQTLSKKQQSAILRFPLNFVPITVRDRLDEVVDKRWLAEEIARRTVGF